MRRKIGSFRAEILGADPVAVNSGFCCSMIPHYGRWRAAPITIAPVAIGAPGWFWSG